MVSNCSTKSDKNYPTTHEYHIVGKTIDFPDENDVSTGVPCYVATTKKLDDDGKTWVINYALLPIDIVGEKSVGEIINLNYSNGEIDAYRFRLINETMVGVFGFATIFFVIILLFCRNF